MGSRDRVLFELPLEHQKKPFNSEEKNPKDQALQEEWGGVPEKTSSWMSLEILVNGL